MTRPTRSAWCLSLVAVLTLVDTLAGVKAAAFFAVVPLLVYFLLEWRRLMLNARILFAVCLVLALLALRRPDALAVLSAAASRMIYLPAFVAMLALLHAAASASPSIAAAGRYLVNQPPQRRYLALSLGGHVFGILFNIGGLVLLVGMTKAANTLEAAGGDPRVVAWRERRMTVAVLRSFGTIVLWSPLGVALNLLLASNPGLAWSEVAPAGFACALAYIALGWLFDQWQRPSGLTVPQRSPETGGGSAVLRMIGHVAAIAVAAESTQYLLRLPFQTVLLIVLPLYAAAWMVGTRFALNDRAPGRRALEILIENGIGRFPIYANEIAVFATSGFLGVVLVALVTPAMLQHVAAGLPLTPGLFAGGIVVTIAALGFVGINPLITASILANAATAIAFPGLPLKYFVLAISLGWACTVGLAPLNSSLVLTAGLIGRTPWEVSIGWNGAFGVTAVIIAVFLFAVLLPG